MNWRKFWQRKRRDEDLTREIESYLAHEADLQALRGLSAEDAAWAAQRKLGNKTTVKEKVWDMNSLTFLESIWQDLRYAARMMRLNPGFFAIAAMSLALGIGANTAIFQLLDAVRLRSLPVENPQQLAELQIAENDHCCSGNFSTRWSNFTYAQWEQIHANQQAFSGIFAFADTQFNLTQTGEVKLAEGLWVTGDYFKTLGVKPLLGRLIASSDDTKACASPSAVISYAFWQKHFNGDAAVLGQTLLLDGNRIEVMGVTPASFFGMEVGRSFDVVLPLCAEQTFGHADAHTNHRNHWWLAIMGRTKAGWTVERAIAQVKTISPAVFENSVPENYRPSEAKYYREYKLTALPAGTGISSLRKNYETPLYLLLGIAALVLLIACGNLANLTLARASAREREMAVRLAIGAGRGRLIRQLLSESLLLTAVGSILGVFVAELLCRYMLAFLTTPQNPLFVSLTPDWRLLSFTAAVAVLTCILFGLTPALRATRTPPAGAMKSAGRGITASRERFSLRRVLVVGQVALSLVLLAAALLFVRSLRNLTTLDAGLRQDGILVMTADISRLQYKPEKRAVIFQTLIEEARRIPGVASVATTQVLPLVGNSWNDVIEFPGVTSDKQMVAWFNAVSAGFFHTVDTRLIAGRDFNEHDTPSSQEVAIVNEEFCRKFLAGGNPLGRQIRMVTGPGEPTHQYEIIGLVKNAKYQNLREDFKPVVFVGKSQDKEARHGIQLLIRSQLGLGALSEALKVAVDKVEPGMSIEFVPFKTRIEESLLRDRLMATLSSFFGFLAAGLATVGLYGVISYMVARRKSEIGIRMALGASRGGVLRLILNEAAVLLAAGLVLGILLAVSSGKAAGTLLFGLKPTDPATIILAVGLLAMVALLASLVPALRAARTEPMAALREE